MEHAAGASQFESEADADCQIQPRSNLLLKVEGQAIRSTYMQVEFVFCHSITHSPLPK